jgi:hypothetical protein
MIYLIIGITLIVSLGIYLAIGTQQIIDEINSKYKDKK